MDTVWIWTLQLIELIQSGLNLVFSPLHVLGPTATIFCIAAVTVVLARWLTQRFKTKRYYRLEQEFRYWYDLRQEALKLKQEDPEKGKALARDIDKGKLNKAYYDYFFEGFLNNLLTMYIPFFGMLTYVNYTYSPEALQELFGRSALFTFTWFNGQSYPVGAAFWFFCSAIMSYLALFLLPWIARKLLSKGSGGNDGSNAQNETP